ncbi:MAG TPA: hypothetical protein VGH99_00170 [Pseudonocardia sp.]
MDPTRSDAGLGIAGVLLGAGAEAADLAWRAGRPLCEAGGGVVRDLWGLTTRLVPGSAMSALAERNESVRAGLARLVDVALRLVVERVVASLLASVDLTALVRDNVDLDALAKGLDVEAVVARVDLDGAVARVDLDAIAGRLDLDRLVTGVDIDAIARRLDLDAIATRLDPDPVVARVDLGSAIARIDLVGIAREVIDAIDLPGIVRDSTGTMASDVVRTVRLEGMQADDLISGLVDRVLRRSREPASPPP